MTTVVESIPSPRAPGATVAVATGGDSAVSWAAVFAGAAVAAAMSLILLLLGTGFGLSSVSPWAFDGVSAETFGWSTIAWISFTSLVASALGGYIAGRLRTRWVSIHGDETFFRDTAHGLLAWSVATLFTATLLTSAIGAILGVGAKAGATVATGIAQGAMVAGAAGAGAMESGDRMSGGDATVPYYTVSYYADSLFRPEPSALATTTPEELAATPVDGDAAMGIAAPSASSPPPAAQSGVARAAPPRIRDAGPLRAEAMRIIANGVRSESLPVEDTRYLARRVAEQTGLDQAAAEARVSQVHARLKASLDDAQAAAKTAADEARKAGAYAALWLFVTLLLGAFASSLFATFGGRQRDF